MTVRVGITSGWEPGTVVDGWPLIYINMGLADRLEKSGAVPIIIPILEDEQRVYDYLDFIDGVIIAGEVLSVKRDVVKAYGTNILRNSNPLRYKNELAAINAAKKYGKPLLGICRGYQVLTIAEGGSVGDRDVNIGSTVLHQQGGVHPPGIGVHTIHITPGSTLAGMLKGESFIVNSFHRQPVEKVPDGYRISAVTEDNCIEAIESIEGPFRMGLQFHPEMLEEPVWMDFFRQFVSIAGKSKVNSDIAAR